MLQNTQFSVGKMIKYHLGLSSVKIFYDSPAS